MERRSKEIKRQIGRFVATEILRSSAFPLIVWVNLLPEKECELQFFSQARMFELVAILSGVTIIRTKDPFWQNKMK